MLLIVSGSIGAAYLPAWLVWLARKHTGLEVRTVLTASAEKFVTRTTVHVASAGEAVPDEWGDGYAGEALHVRWAEWAEAVLVYPASMNYLARLANGMADSPSLLAIHCGRAPVLVAPGLPPGAVEGSVYASHVRALRERPDMDVIPPMEGTSLTTGEQNVAASAWFPQAMARLEQMYRGRLPPADGPAARPAAPVDADGARERTGDGGPG